MESGQQPRGRNAILPRVFITVCFGILVLLVVSCSSTAMRRANEDSFNLVVENFHNAVRWGDYQTAATFVGPTMQEDFWRISDALQKRVSIMECQVKRSSFDPIRKTGEVALFVRYYAKDKPEVITSMIHERWKFFEKEKMWYLVSHDLNALEN